MLERDTDADWRHIGAVEPHWGVLTNPEFKQAVLDAAALEHFYATGRSDIAGFTQFISQQTRTGPRWGRALDFGCGVGRLSEAMVDHADSVVGYDISEGMLATARAHRRGVTYVDALPDGPFDWINSYIVFQHIAPERGYELLEQLLARLSFGGVVSLHFTVDRHPDAPRIRPPTPRPPWWRGLLGFEGERWRDDRPLGAVSTYDYDMNRLTATMRSHGLGDLGLHATSHSGHYGYLIAGRRDQPPADPPG